jgi:hypothetical protein
VGGGDDMLGNGRRERRGEGRGERGEGRGKG